MKQITCSSPNLSLGNSRKGFVKKIVLITFIIFVALVLTPTQSNVTASVHIHPLTNYEQAVFTPQK